MDVFLGRLWMEAAKQGSVVLGADRDVDEVMKMSRMPIDLDGEYDLSKKCLLQMFRVIVGDGFLACFAKVDFLVDRFRLEIARSVEML